MRNVSFARAMAAIVAFAFVMSPVQAAPAFAPAPKPAFDGFVAINPPRADVPVGALWVDDYGPTGEAATQDNLETVRSLSGMSIDKGFQLALSAGILQLIGIDPKAQSHYSAHFGDLSIVRLKDPAKLSGPQGEPRIVEALKAGSVTVSSDSDLGLGGQLSGFSASASGNATVDRTHAYSIEAHDMFIAVRVAIPERIATKEEDLRLDGSRNRATIRDYSVTLDSSGCIGAICTLSVAVSHIGAAEAQPSPYAQLTPGETRLTLPVPTADGQGGLFDSLLVRRILPCSVQRTDGCRNKDRLLAHFEGRSLRSVEQVRAPGW